jgi:hypothetical protein
MAFPSRGQAFMASYRAVPSSAALSGHARSTPWDPELSAIYGEASDASGPVTEQARQKHGLGEETALSWTS